MIQAFSHIFNFFNIAPPCGDMRNHNFNKCKEEKGSSLVSNMDSAIDDLDNGIRLENTDDLRRALDVFIRLREEMEVILGKPKSDTESSCSDDYSDETADDDSDSDG
jgi:hypothetical protein